MIERVHRPGFDVGRMGQSFFAKSYEWVVNKLAVKNMLLCMEWKVDC